MYDYHYDTTASNIEWRSQTSGYYSSPLDGYVWGKPLPVLPNNWRWFHCFWKKAALFVAWLDCVPMVEIRRPKSSEGDRRRNKRKGWIEAFRMGA